MSKLRYIPILVIVPLILLYLYSMVVQPFFITEGDLADKWKYLQETWITWQTFNAAMIALIASVIAIMATYFIHLENKRKAEQERKRTYSAWLALVPLELKALNQYTKDALLLLDEIWENITDGETHELKHKPPQVPSTVGPVFRDCIKSAEPAPAKAFATILAELQVVSSILEGEYLNYPYNIDKCDLNNYISYFHRVADLRAQTNKLFPYGRKNELDDKAPAFDTTPVNEDDLLRAMQSVLLRGDYDLSDIEDFKNTDLVRSFVSSLGEYLTYKHSD